MKSTTKIYVTTKSVLLILISLSLISVLFTNCNSGMQSELNKTSSPSESNNTANGGIASCAPSQAKSCRVLNGIGVQQCAEDGSGYGECALQGQNSQCVSYSCDANSMISCAAEHGAGIRICSGPPALARDRASEC